METNEMKKEYLRMYWNQYRIKHPEQIAEIQRTYRQKHRDALNAYHREYRKAHPEKVQAYREKAKKKAEVNK